MTRKFRPLTVETFEDRLVPTVNFLFDYRFDTTNFFSDPARKAALEQVGRDIGGHLDVPLAAVVPGGPNTSVTQVRSPATDEIVGVPNLAVPANTIVVFVGSRNLPGVGQAAQGGGGATNNISVTATADYVNSVRNRVPGGVSVVAGSITFDTDPNFYYGSDATIPFGQTDFYTTATHELGHVLGIGASTTFTSLTTADGFFQGTTAKQVFGGPVPLNGADGHAHFSAGTTARGQTTSLQPTLVNGERYGFSALDLAALNDLGWRVNSLTPTFTNTAGLTRDPDPVPVPPVPTPPAPTPPADPTPGTPPQAPPDEPLPPPCKCGACAGCVAVSGKAGTVQLFDSTTQQPVGDVVTPFPGFFGTVRATTADVNGDGTPDLIAVTGPGGGSRVRVIDGKTDADLANTSAFESGFTGGLYLAAADIDGDGRAEVIVTPDQGGGGRVTVLKVTNGSATVAANFFGIQDDNFRGGARVAAADLNGDGRADIVVGAGFGGGPRVAIFDGATVATSSPRKLVNDFFAFGGADADRLRNGVFIAAGDLNGDGKAELAFGGGPGGGPRVLVLDGATVLTSPVFAAANPLRNFFAGSTTDRGGVRLTITDTNHDGTNDLVAGSGTSGTVTTFLNGDPARGTAFDPLGASYLTDGVFVG